MMSASSSRSQARLSKFELAGLLGVFAVMMLVGAWVAGTRGVAERRLLHVDQNRLDFGQAWVARDFRWDLPITNESNFKDVQIVDFRTSCQCTSVAPIPLIIPSGKTKTVQLTIDLTSYRQAEGDGEDQPFSLTLRPILNEPRASGPVWRLTGLVRDLFANVDGFVTIDEDLVYGSAPVLRTSFSVTTRRPVRALSVNCRKSFVQAQLRADRRGPNRYLVDIAFRRGLDPGEYEFDLFFGGVLSNGEPIRQAPLRVACRILEDIQVLPSQLLLGLLNPDEERSAAVVIRSRRAEPFELVDVRTDSDEISVRPHSTRRRQVGELALDVIVRSASPGFHRQTIDAVIRLADAPTSDHVRLDVLYNVAEGPPSP